MAEDRSRSILPYGLVRGESQQAGDSFLSIGFIQCPAAGGCIALGLPDQGSACTPVYASNP